MHLAIFSVGSYCDDWGLFEPTGLCQPGYYCLAGKKTYGASKNLCIVHKKISLYYILLHKMKGR